MITEVTGNLLEAQVQALVNTVNTVGVMGKGIALQFKRAYQAMFKAYAKDAKAGAIHLGKMHVFETGAISGPRFVINFPTKGHWKSPSRLSDIEAGLVDLVRVVKTLGIASIAIPPLGCGNGGLHWSEVYPLIVAALEELPETEAQVFVPTGPPPARAMGTQSQRPKMTILRAALVSIINRYQAQTEEVSILEVQKLMYFLQGAGEPLKLNYAKNQYGPYADNLRHALHAMEGHFLVGYGDASRSVYATEPIEVLAGAVPEAEAFLVGHPETVARNEWTLGLLSGFETPYGAELLSTVHWVATHEAASHGADIDDVYRLITQWSSRTERMFGTDHVNLAWQRLRDHGWLSAPVPAPCDRRTHWCVRDRLAGASAEAPPHRRRRVPEVTRRYVALFGPSSPVDELVSFRRGPPRSQTARRHSPSPRRPLHSA